MLESTSLEPQLPLFLALDSDDNKIWQKSFFDTFSSEVYGFKVGPRVFFNTHKIELLKKIKSPLFVDCKFFDIPKTMLASVRAAFDFGASYVTVHTLCGSESLEKLKTLELELNKIRPFKILCVTVLTSYSIANLGWQAEEIKEEVLRLAQQAYSSGLKSFVCSALEVAELKKNFPDAYFVTPGVRLPSDEKGDQVRVVGPKEALSNGADKLVVGRPLVQAQDIGFALKTWREALV